MKHQNFGILLTLKSLLLFHMLHFLYIVDGDIAKW